MSFKGKAQSGKWRPESEVRRPVPASHREQALSLISGWLNSTHFFSYRSQALAFHSSVFNSLRTLVVAVLILCLSFCRGKRTKTPRPQMAFQPGYTSLRAASQTPPWKRGDSSKVRTGKIPPHMPGNKSLSFNYSTGSNSGMRLILHSAAGL